MSDGMKLGEGVPFDNGPTCKGVAYPIEGSENDFSAIEIIGRYPPESGVYATNLGSREEVRVEEGAGWLIRMSNAGFLSQESLSVGSEVAIEPGENFAWLSGATQQEAAVELVPAGLSLDEVLAQVLNEEAPKKTTGMKLAMLCIPAFDPEKYIPGRTENEIRQAHTKEGEK